MKRLNVMLKFSQFGFGLFRKDELHEKGREMERIREEIKCEYEEKLARMRVEYKLKENKHEKQVERMFDKMKQYEIKLEGIVRESEADRCSNLHLGFGSSRHSDKKWKKDYDPCRIGDHSHRSKT